MEEQEIKKDSITENKEPTSDVKKESKPKKFKEKNKKIDKEKEELLVANLELKEKVLRITAEMQNMRRRYDLDIASLHKYDGFDMVEKLLPIIDNFERAMNIKTEGSEKFLAGLKMIYDN